MESVCDFLPFGRHQQKQNPEVHKLQSSHQISHVGVMKEIEIQFESDIEMCEIISRI